MATSFTVARIGGIPIRVNVSLLVFLPILAWLIGSGSRIQLYVGVIDSLTATPIGTAPLQRGVVPWLIGTLAAVGLFVSVTVHELGHSWVARRYGVVIQSITLWIFGGVASMETIPREWNREFWIAIAGPITSLLIGGGCLLVLQYVPASYPIAVFLVGWLGMMNVVLAVFNLVPAFPMDGGRVFRAILARWLSYTRATHTAARVGEVFALLFAIVGVLSFNVVLILVALFVYGAAVSEYRTVALTDLFEGVTAEDVMTTELPTVTAETDVSTLADRMVRERSSVFLVVESPASGRLIGDPPIAGEERAPDSGSATGSEADRIETEHVLGTISLEALRGRSVRPTDPVRNYLSRNFSSVEAETAAVDVLLELLETRRDRVLVERGGRPIGVITKSGLMETADLLEKRRLV